jgi:hypothetical protein
MHAILDDLPVSVVIADPAGRLEFANRCALEYLARPFDELVHWLTADVVHPDDRAGVAAVWERGVAGQEKFQFECRLHHGDGAHRSFDVRAAPRRDAEGRVRWCVVAQDIEDRKHGEREGARVEAARGASETSVGLTSTKSERFLLEVQRVSRTGGWRYDVATNLVETSPELERIYGVQPGEDCSKLEFWVDRIHPDDRDRIQALFAQAVRDGTEYHAGSRIVRPDGSIVYQYATGHPVLDGDGNLVEFIGATMDMTDQWLANNELQRASEALRGLEITMARAAQVAAVAELAASIAHEVNQPLAGIIANTGTCRRMLDATPPNVEGARETVRRTLRDSNRAVEVIARLRSLFSKKAFTLESFDLNEATREVMALSLGDILRNGVTLKSELAEDLPPITGDRIQLQQVILNLLRNGSDAMSDVQGRPRLLVVRTERLPDDHVGLTVRDAGVGIDGDTANRLFDAFYSTKSGGMGMGLSVSRNIIEHHQGRIWASANEDAGATFTFAIPCRQPLEEGGNR